MGEELAPEQKVFIERVLPRSIKCTLSNDKLAVHRPFQTIESRRPIAQFPRELPIARELEDVYAALKQAHARGALR